MKRPTVNPGNIRKWDPEEFTQVGGFLLPDQPEGLLEVDLPVADPLRVHPVAGGIRDIAEDASRPIGIVVGRDRVDPAVRILDEVAGAKRLHSPLPACSRR